MTKRLILICTLGALAGAGLVAANPVSSTMLKLALLGCIAAVWVGLTILVWQRKLLRSLVLILPLVALVPPLLPGGEIDADELRQDHIRRMKALEGTRYHWGGESPRGIDCSGLPRRALRDALLAYGAKHLNGRAFRRFLEHWWFDASAKALGEGYRDYTREIGDAGSIRQMDYGGLLPGDLAVTTDGVHILAYIGDGRWIQADPGIGAVVTLDGRTGDNVWLQVPVTTHRWRDLDAP